MDKLAQYRARMQQCLAFAHTAQSAEIGQLWGTIASSYRFLMEREEWMTTGGQPYWSGPSGPTETGMD